MNLILVSPEEVADGRCVLRDARATHLRQVLHAEPGQTVQLGILDGLAGIGTVEAVTPEAVTVLTDCTRTPLAPWYDLILALPRPRSLRRILFQSATMGVRNIFVVGASKVEKSYFSMHLLREEVYRPVLIEGLMQGKTTALPRLVIIPKLRDLWEQLPADSGARYIANPAEARPVIAKQAGLPLIAIGPDGGWTDQETEAFLSHGFEAVSLGPRPLRTDTAAIALPAVIQALGGY